MSFKKKAQDILKTIGIKETALRTDVLSLLLDNKKPVTAYDLLEQLKLLRPSAQPMTVYRILDLYIEAHLMHKIEKDNTYILCCHPDDTLPCQIIVCQQCHQHTEIHDKKLAQVIAKTLASLNYTTHDQTLQIPGICAQCHKAA